MAHNGLAAILQSPSEPLTDVLQKRLLILWQSRPSGGNDRARPVYRAPALIAFPIPNQLSTALTVKDFLNF
jgi:hypothetical protein